MSDLVAIYNPGTTKDECAIAYIPTCLEDLHGLDKKNPNQFPFQATLPVTKETTIANRQKQFEAFVRNNPKFHGIDVACIATRGAILPGASSGVTVIDSNVINAINDGHVGTIHVSNNAPLVGFSVAEKMQIQAYFADPISSIEDEYFEVARMTGHPELKIEGFAHYLNMREAIARYAAQKSIPINQVNIILVHAGNGISVAAVSKGKIVAVNNANEAGPYSDTRIGNVPALEMVDWILKHSDDGRSAMDIKKILLKNSGLLKLSGCGSYEDALEKAIQGDSSAIQALTGMYFKIAEEIGKRLIDLRGQVSDLVLTGGMAHEEEFADGIAHWLRPENCPDDPTMLNIVKFPGSFEIESLARQAIMAHNNDVPIHTYQYEK